MAEPEVITKKYVLMFTSEEEYENLKWAVQSMGAEIEILAWESQLPDHFPDGWADENMMLTWDDLDRFSSGEEDDAWKEE